MVYANAMLPNAARFTKLLQPDRTIRHEATQDARAKATGRSPALDRCGAGQGPTLARWYGLAIWKSIRTHQLAEHPLCARCLDDGRVVLATVVNHVDPHRGDWDKFISGPFESCCKPCHDSIVQREERAAARLERDRRGGGSKV
jgi:hypothetical protein